MSKASASLNKHVQNREYCKQFTAHKIIDIMIYLQLNVMMKLEFHRQ